MPHFSLLDQSENPCFKLKNGVCSVTLSENEEVWSRGKLEYLGTSDGNHNREVYITLHNTFAGRSCLPMVCKLKRRGIHNKIMKIAENQEIIRSLWKINMTDV